MVRDIINYANFKSTVAKIQGYKRSHVYSEVWEDLWALKDEEGKN